MGRPDTGLSIHIQQLRPWHRKMVRDVVAGATPKELKERYGYTSAMISRIINSPLFKAEVGRLEAQAEAQAVDVNKDLRVMAERAVEILDEELESEPENLPQRKLRKDTAFGVLDRAGYGKKDQPVHLHKHEHVHVQEMSEEELYRDVIDIVEEKGD